MREEAKVEEDEFISLRDMTLMLLRHRWKILTVTVVVTVCTAVISYLMPRKYEVEAYLQVLPKSTYDSRPDRDLTETSIMSHLQRMQTAFIAERVADEINAQTNAGVPPLSAIQLLQRQVKITRPPKTDLIRIVSRCSDSDLARKIAYEWLEQYLKSVRVNNMIVETARLRDLAQKAQAEAYEKSRNVAQLRSLIEQTPEYINLSRGLGDTQLWKELSDRTDPQKLTELSAIQIREQTVNVAYMALSSSLTLAEQSCAEAMARSNFYDAVIKLLEKIDLRLDQPINIDLHDVNDDAAKKYVTMLVHGITDSDIVLFGKPALASARRGAIRKTVLSALATLAIASMCAFVVEWLRNDY